MEQVTGLEPVSSDWKSEILTFIQYLHLVGSEGLEPPMAISNRFTVCPDTNYGLPTHIESLFSYVLILTNHEWRLIRDSNPYLPRDSRIY